jgi:hypothetical protein
MVLFDGFMESITEAICPAPAFAKATAGSQSGLWIPCRFMVNNYDWT